jgi:hypothetical protein
MPAPLVKLERFVREIRYTWSSRLKCSLSLLMHSAGLRAGPVYFIFVEHVLWSGRNVEGGLSRQTQGFNLLLWWNLRPHKNRRHFRQQKVLSMLCEDRRVGRASRTNRWPNSHLFERFGFSKRCCWIFISSGMFRRLFTDVSDDGTAFTFSMKLSSSYSATWLWRWKFYNLPKRR